MAAEATKLSVYAWEGTDRKGTKVRGELSGQNPALIKIHLRRQGITPGKVRKKAVPLLRAGKRIKPADIALFTRQMATMMKAGVPMLQAFDIIAEGFDNPNMRTLVSELKQDVAGGSSFTTAVRNKPRHFDELYCDLIDAGEQAGALDTLLDRVATYKEKTERLKARIKKAMTYPMIVLLVATLVSGILLVQVVPQFQRLFEGFGAELPLFTQWVIALSHFMQQTWWMLLAGIIGLVLGLRHAYRHQPAIRAAMDQALLKLPIVGTLLGRSAVARYARTLSTTFTAGVPLIEALASVAGATGNVVFKEAVQRIGQDVASGMQISLAMRGSGLFPNLAVQMTAIGEESGALDDMLDKVATHYENEVDNMVDNLTSLMEPLIMVVLGTLVGGLVVAMYLPLFKLGEVV
ncbi:Type II secretion system protein F [compost metagenome]